MTEDKNQMTAQEKQASLDSEETMSLITKGVINLGNILETVDQNVNGVGHQTVELHKNSQDLMDDLVAQGEDLKDIKQSQEKVQHSNEELVKAVDKTNSNFKENNQVLSQIKEALETQEKSRQTRHSDLLNKVNALQEGTDHGVTHLSKQVKDMQEVLKTADTKNELTKIIKNIDDTNGLLDHVAGINSKNDEKLGKRFASLNSRLEETIKKLDTVSSHTEKLNTAVNKVDGHLDAVTMQLNAIGKSANVDFSKTDVDTKKELEKRVNQVTNTQKEPVEKNASK